MDIHTQLIAEVSNIPYLKEWEELQALFRRVASGRPGHWLLPLHVCQAVGGTEEQAIPAIVAVACSHIGIVLVDDMLDVDPRGEHVKIGESAVANMASSLQAAALVAISTSRLGADAKLTAMEGVNEMFLETTLGQHWDVTSIVQDEDSYWRIARAKSSPFFGASFQVGALMGGASVEIANQIREVGRLYGEMIQIHDDVNDTLAVPVRPDWGVDRSPLPILFASLVDHPLRARFVELRPHVGIHSKALEEAQEILIRCGAVSYCIHQLLERHKLAKGIFGKLEIEQLEVLEKVLNDVVQPVFRLFQEADASISGEALAAYTG